jgi:hypothetical protein
MLCQHCGLSKQPARKSNLLGGCNHRYAPLVAEGAPHSSPHQLAYVISGWARWEVVRLDRHAT